MEKDFILSLDTAIIRPVYNDLKLQSEVLTLSHKSIIVALDCFSLVKNTCDYCGRSVGRAIKEANELLGPYHKIPIVVDMVAGQPFVLIPLQSPRSVLNTWVALHAIELHRKSTVNSGFTDIQLVNGTVVTVNASFTTFNRQLVLANALRTSYLKRRDNRQHFLTYSSDPLIK